VSLTESTSRAGFQVALEASRNFLGFEGEIGFQLPRSSPPSPHVALATARRFALWVAQRQGGWRKRGLPRCSPRGTSGMDRCSGVIRGVPAIELRSRVRLRPFNPLLRRDAFALFGSTRGRLAKAGLPRRSQRGTSGRKRVRRLERPTSSLARKIDPREKNGPLSREATPKRGQARTGAEFLIALEQL
jgi:hypothetical protein